MKYPKCFNDIAEFSFWQELATRSKETASPCCDCSKGYKQEMQKQNRCNEREVKAQFRHRHGKRKTIFLTEALA
jgi:hypothetical protein